MIVKPSELKNTYFVQQMLKTPIGSVLTDEDLDQPLAWHLDLSLLEDLSSIDIPVAIIDGTGHVEDGLVNGGTTTFLDTGEPAILLYVTRSAPTTAVSRIFIHEYRHAMQIRDGRLKFIDGNIHWMGVEQPFIPPVAVEDKYREAMGTINKLRYMAQPWEFEADHMIRNTSLPGMVFHRLIKRYGTTWPVHWSPEYVAKRYYALKDWRAVVEELYQEGF